MELRLHFFLKNSMSQRVQWTKEDVLSRNTYFSVHLRSQGFIIIWWPSWYHRDQKKVLPTSSCNRQVLQKWAQMKFCNGCKLQARRKYLPRSLIPPWLARALLFVRLPKHIFTPGSDNGCFIPTNLEKICIQEFWVVQFVEVLHPWTRPQHGN